MGNFSFKSKRSGKSVKINHEVRMYLLKDGEIIEEMYGEYDGYGRVFKNDTNESQEWKMDWSDVCNLMFHDSKKNGIAVILESDYKAGFKPKTRSADCPTQGWCRSEWEKPSRKTGMESAHIFG